MLSAEPALVRTSLVDLATRIYGSPGIAQSMWKIVEGSRRLNDDTHNQAIFSTVLMSRIINDTDLPVPRELMMSLYPLGQATLTDLYPPLQGVGFTYGNFGVSLLAGSLGL